MWDINSPDLLVCSVFKHAIMIKLFVITSFSGTVQRRSFLFGLIVDNDLLYSGVDLLIIQVFFLNFPSITETSQQIFKVDYLCGRFVLFMS